jgi:hypothetical protein
MRRRADRPDGSIRIRGKGRPVILTDRIPDEGFREPMEDELLREGYLVLGVRLAARPLRTFAANHLGRCPARSAIARSVCTASWLPPPVRAQASR